MSYTAQELNTRVELQRSTYVQNEFGEPIYTWTTYGQAFAKVEPLVGREFIAAGAEQSEINAKVTMRWRADVDLVHRLLIRGEAYEIISAQNIRYQNRELLLYVKRLR